MKVLDAMSPSALCLRSDATLAEAVTLMRQLDTAVVAVCEDGRLVGLVTERDVSERVRTAEGRGARLCVRDVLSPAGIAFVYDDEPLAAASQVMQRHQLPLLPVLNRDRRVVGTISAAELARANAVLPSEPSAP